MKIVKTRRGNKMGDDFFANSLVIYIQREIVKTYSVMRLQIILKC